MVDDRTALMTAKALEPGYEVLWYTINQVLGQGGFGITYLAHDRNLDRAVAIKEYLPTSFAFRQHDHSVKPMTGDHRENFNWGLGSFLKEAQTLARFSHRNIVRVHSVFEENNTAYMVMEYEHGQNLARVYRHDRQLDQVFFEQIFFPIMDGLKEIHKFDFIHRDIKPANIYIREDGTPVLIDFGSARQTSQQQTGEMTTLVSQGYTPLEQYSANYGEQGPWTDIYAMAASLYEGIIGHKPDEALSRSACMLRAKPDLLQPLLERDHPGFSQRFLDAVFAGLKLEPEGRPQTLEAWRRLFDDGIDARLEYPIRDQSSAGNSIEVVDGVSAESPVGADDVTYVQPLRPVASEPLDDFDSFSDVEPDSSVRSATAVPRSTWSNHDSALPLVDATVVQPLRQEPARSMQESVLHEVPVNARTQSVSTKVAPKSTQQDQSRNGQSAPEHAQSARTTKQQTSGGRHKGWLAAVAAVLVLLAIGIGGYLYRSDTIAPGLSIASLAGLTGPAQAASIRLPREGVLEQLDNMLSLAPLLDEAWKLAPDDPVLLDTIRATEASLLSLARQWNASQYSSIADRIVTVSQALPVGVHDSNRLQSVLADSPQTSYADVMALLESEQYLAPAGNSVLDRITAVSAEDYQRLLDSDSWQHMMDELASIALERVSESRYEEAARITEAALTLDARHEGFEALRQFLQGA